MLIAPFWMRASGGMETDINIAASQPNTFNQIFWLATFGITFLASLKRLDRLPGILADPVVVVIFAYLALATLSIFWSPAPGVALRRLVLQVILILCFILSIGLGDSREATLNRLIALVIVTVAVNCVAVVLIPPSEIGYEGIYTQKNGLGGVMAFALLILLGSIPMKRGLSRLVLLGTACAAFVVLVLSQSKTSLGLAVMVPVLVFAFVSLAYHLRINAFALLLLLASTGLILIAFLSAVTGFGLDDLSMVLFHDTTFTNRTVIWNFVLDVIGRSWLIGQGYSSFWGIGADSIVFREAPSFVSTLLQSHNGYLDVLIETGVIGFALLMILILAALHAAARLVQTDRAMARICLMLVLFAVCHNLLESSWYRSFSQVWMLFICAALLPQLPSSRSVRSGQRVGNTSGAGN
ncbi:O-antigen ligase family protein [Ciceribacter naphthalenivorans]|nr:O-antigen ligase family protein [Ciceribacter naphthalenivorans]